MACHARARLSPSLAPTDPLQGWNMAVPLAQLKAAGVNESTETSCRDLAGITGSHKGAVSDLRTLAQNPHTFFLRVGVEPGIPRHQLRHLAPFALLRFYRRQVRIAAAPGTAVAWAGPSTPALFDTLVAEFRPTDHRRLVRVPYHINDPRFAEIAAEGFLTIAQ